MAQRRIPLVEGEFFHVYNRGNSKQNIFLDDHDRDRFMKLLYLCNSKKSFNFRNDIVRTKINAWDFDRGETIVAIGAWVLMSNHFHIYITPKPCLGEECLGDEEKQTTITEFMHKLLTSYSKYFNKKYKRSGSLFESEFKSVHIDSDPQAKYIFSYIHLNPIKLIDSKWKESGVKDFKKTQNFLKSYKWSSYLDFKRVVRSENKILDSKVFPEYFHCVKDFDTEIREWMTSNSA